MKIEVNISEFYLGEEGELQEELVRHIKSGVVSDITKSIQAKVDAQITMEVKDTVEKMLYAQISKAITQTLSTGTTKSRQNSNSMITFDEYVRECFTYSGGWQSFDDTIKKLAQSFTTELKNRYDLMFASQIVVKMGDAGLLKSDELKKLLEDRK
jgi:hypothetical protein